MVTARVTCRSKMVYGLGTEYEHVTLGFIADPKARGRNRAWSGRFAAALQLTMTMSPEIAEQFSVNRPLRLTIEAEDED